MFKIIHLYMRADTAWVWRLSMQSGQVKPRPSKAQKEFFTDLSEVRSRESRDIAQPGYSRRGRPLDWRTQKTKGELRGHHSLDL